MITARTTAAVLLALLMVSGCAPDDGADDETPADPDTAAVAQRLDELQLAVTAWASATQLTDARAAAEVAANLVLGPGGPGFGDRDGDGTVDGDVAQGLLTGVGGTPAGLASSLADDACVARDVLGATAQDVDAGWREMEAAIAAWSPTGNTMPTLASHPMRVVGWATFTLDTDELDVAHEYAGHAQLHVRVSRDALGC